MSNVFQVWLQQGDCVYLQEGVQCQRSLYCLFKIHRHHWPGNTGLWRHCQLLSQNPEVSVNETLTVTRQGIIVCIFLGFWTWGSSSPAGSEMLKTVARRHCGNRLRPDCKGSRVWMIPWTLIKIWKIFWKDWKCQNINFSNNDINANVNYNWKKITNDKVPFII